jgi:hypothetical protein
MYIVMDCEPGYQMEQATAAHCMVNDVINAGSCFHCHSMTWDAPADFLHDTTVMFREEINLTPVYPKLLS